MLECPHCNKPIEVVSSGPKSVPWYKYDSGGPAVGLGCGTLIIIALIVAIFSDDSDVLRQVRSLEVRLERIETSIEKLSSPPSTTEPTTDR